MYAMYWLVRLVVIVGLFVLARFCFRKMLYSKPHSLKKEPVLISFERSLLHELQEPLAVLGSTKVELVGTAIWAVVTTIALGLYLRGIGSILYFLPCCGGIFYTLWLSTRKLILYENAVVLQTMTGRKVYYLDEIDCIVSYNIVNSFNRGVSWGYHLMRDGAAVESFPRGSFPELDSIEEVYCYSPHVREFTKR